VGRAGYTIGGGAYWEVRKVVRRGFDRVREGKMGYLGLTKPEEFHCAYHITKIHVFGGVVEFSIFADWLATRKIIKRLLDPPHEVRQACLLNIVGGTCINTRLDFGYCLVAGCEPLVLKLVDA
jgi:hypothetical protein